MTKILPLVQSGSQDARPALAYLRNGIELSNGIRFGHFKSLSKLNSKSRLGSKLTLDTFYETKL